jgi:hypothetical protein
MFGATFSGENLQMMYFIDPRYVTNDDKYAVSFDPVSGEVGLLIREIGPGDEGEYCCTATNAYGSVTARLNVNPERKKNTLKNMSDTRLSLQRGGGSSGKEAADK